MKEQPTTNYRIIFRLVGIALIIESLFMFLCLPFSFYYKAGDHHALIYSGLITLMAGVLPWLLTLRNHSKEMFKREGYLTVVLAWVMMSAFGTLPYLFSRSAPVFTDAFFETISGFSTTGASIFTDIESVPEGILFWRSITHWMGGMGIIVLSVAILPFLGHGGMQLFNAEATGPMKDKLHPRIQETAKRLWGIYLLLTILQTIFLMAGGMSIYDALCHSFGTVATGGFSTKNASLGHYSPYIQYVCVVFMLLAAINFTLHFRLLRGEIRNVIRDNELRLFLGIMFAATAIAFLVLSFTCNYPTELAFRASLFQVVSIGTCTGFASDDYLLWPSSLSLLMLILMFIGGSAGSTTGSIKVMRHLMMVKAAFRQFKLILHPSAVIPLRYNGAIVSSEVIHKIFVFFMLYVSTFTIGTIAMCFSGDDLVSSAGAVASCMGGVGPGLGDYGPAANYASAAASGKWILSFCMLAGRLELFSFFILFAPSFWKK
jgi:trk system potassium uptake protein